MKKAAILALASLFVSSAANAADYSEAKAACASAIADKVGKSIDGAETKLVKARTRGATIVNVEVVFADGAKAAGDCRVRRGAVEELTLSE